MDNQQPSKRKRTEDTTTISAATVTMTFMEWYAMSKMKIGYTSIKDFFSLPDGSPKEDCISRLHMLASAIPVREEQMRIKNLLPPGFGATYDDEGILESSIIYGGERITSQRALVYLGLFQVASKYQAIHTVRLKGGAALIVKPYAISEGLFITESRVTKMNEGSTHLLDVALHILTMEFGDLNPFHYVQLSVKALAANRHFSKSDLTETDWVNLKVAGTSKDRAVIDVVLGKARNPAIKSFIREIDSIISAGSTIAELCNEANLNVYTRKSLISVLTTQARLNVTYRTKGGTVYLDSERTVAVEPKPITECDDTHAILVMKNAMGHSSYGRLTGATTVYAVPAGTASFYVPFGAKNDRLAEKTCKLQLVDDFKKVVTAIGKLSVQTGQTTTPAAAPATVAAATSDQTTMPIAKIDDAAFD